MVLLKRQMTASVRSTRREAAQTGRLTAAARATVAFQASRGVRATNDLLPAPCQGLCREFDRLVGLLGAARDASIPSGIRCSEAGSATGGLQIQLMGPAFATRLETSGHLALDPLHRACAEDRFFRYPGIMGSCGDRAFRGQRAGFGRSGTA